MIKVFILIIWALISLGCTGRNTPKHASAMVNPVQAPTYTYRVKGVYPHSVTSYTQGLVWYNGGFIEGTGEYGSSQLMTVDLESGHGNVRQSLNEKFFGEGVAIVGDTIFQLTWLENTVYLYRLHDFSPIGIKAYEGEGWGLTTDGNLLYMSDGSDRVFVRNPKTFDTERTINVRLNSGRVTGLNELEWVNGEIWANVYMSDVIVRIDPQSGNVTGVIDLTGLLPESDRTADTDVLNGIAYDPVSNRIFVTGKNWSKLFEIEIIKK